jgi:hypothetical protein
MRPEADADSFGEGQAAYSLTSCTQIDEERLAVRDLPTGRSVYARDVRVTAAPVM